MLYGLKDMWFLYNLDFSITHKEQCGFFQLFIGWHKIDTKTIVYMD
jgi:hypothetical protein